MQTKATCLNSSPTSYKVRLQFVPINEAEAKNCRALLLDPSVAISMVTLQGPMSVDLIFASKSAPKSVPVKPASAVPPTDGKQAPAPALTDEQKAAMLKPDPTDKPA